MRLSIIGAGGRTGSLLARLAMAEGHRVTGVTRDPKAHVPGLHRAITGDATDPTVAAEAARDCDAVITTVSGPGRGPNTMVSDITKAVVTAMIDASVTRLVITSSRNITATKPWLFTAPTKWVFRHVYADLARAEELVRTSGLDWTIVRAVMLTDDPERGGVHIDSEDNPTGGHWKLPRADYARVLLDTALSNATVRRAIGVNGKTLHEGFIVTTHWNDTLDAMAAAWNGGDARQYGEQFTEDATYIIYNGHLLTGRRQIEEVHRHLFEGPLRGSTMAETDYSHRELSPGLVHVIGTGGVKTGETLTADRRSIVSLVLVERPEGWRIAAFQNTRSPGE